MMAVQWTLLATDIISKMRLFKNYTYIQTSPVEWAVVTSSQNSNFIGDWVNIFNENQRRIYMRRARPAATAQHTAARKLEAMCDTKPDKTTGFVTSLGHSSHES